MSLTALFAQSAPPATWDAFVALPDLEGVLRQLVQEGQAGWRQLVIAPEQFVIFLARQLPSEAAAPAELSSLRARELFLTCALLLGHPAAQAIFETEYMPRVRRALRQAGAPEPMITDIQQNLYRRLIERQDAGSSRRGYTGTGSLTSWLCTCAIREAGLQHKRAQRELALDQAAGEILRDLGKSPESAVLSGHLKQIFQAAFKEAVAALTSRERNLLRYHFLAELSIDQIGTLYHVHRATAARWLQRAQQRLVTKARELFIARANVSDESLPRIMELIQSQLSVNIGSVLKGAAEKDRSSGGIDPAD